MTEERDRSPKTKLCRHGDPVYWASLTSILQIRHFSLWASRRSLASFLAFKASSLKLKLLSLPPWRSKGFIG
jgi:hypothetical protein